jgi:hypothetical protein
MIFAKKRQKRSRTLQFSSKLFCAKKAAQKLEYIVCDVHKIAPSKQSPKWRKFAQFGHPGPGTDVMIFKIFSPKSSAKKLPFLT